LEEILPLAPEIEFFLYHQVTDSVKKVEKNAGKETAEEGVSRRSVKERVRILKLVLIQWIVFDLLLGFILLLTCSAIRVKSPRENRVLYLQLNRSEI